ncbi:MAG: LTA synthase family protein [Candidatus Izimaplasma sp.]|nr:LTA synthase family protein [Candidatus Izimaplasma bacterium]
MKQKLLNAFTLFSMFLLSIIYLEILFKSRVLTFSLDLQLLRVILFSLSYTFFVMFFLMFFKPRTVQRLSLFFIVVVSFLFLNQEVYHSFVEGFYSFRVIGDFTAGLSFFSDYFLALRFGHITYFFPLIGFIALLKFNMINFEIEYGTIKQPLILLIISVLTLSISVQSISDKNNIDSTDVPLELIDISDGTLINYNDVDLYTYVYNNQEALQKFGILTYTQRDFFNLFRKDPITKKAYDVLITDYLENRDGHSDNNMTGLFEDKNFILIMAESFDTFAINETLTPNLYSLKQNYAYFENYYSPLYYRSTADTEFLAQTSMYPNKNVTLSMDAYQNNLFPNTLPKLFKDADYSTFSFHNYTDYFYPRGDFHLDALGYDQYWGSEELGITSNFNPDAMIIDHVWQSDYDLMKRAIPKFINDNQFFVNLLTVSGHFQYTENHEMAKPEYVAAVMDYLETENLVNDVPDDIVYYLAVQMEFDKAIGYLIDALEEANRLDDTVIMIFGDHYAYGITNDDIWEYEDQYKIDQDELDIHNVPMMIVSDETSFNGIHSEYMSSIDILPTVANLFNLETNYRHLFGNDIFDSQENVVHFANGSLISSRFRYDSMTQHYITNDDTVTDYYLLSLNTAFVNRYLYNVRILEYDYFKKR